MRRRYEDVPAAVGNSVAARLISGGLDCSHLLGRVELASDGSDELGQVAVALALTFPFARSTPTAAVTPRWNAIPAAPGRAGVG